MPKRCVPRSLIYGENKSAIRVTNVEITQIIRETIMIRFLITAIANEIWHVQPAGLFQ
jgi:hypothetical protein